MQVVSVRTAGVLQPYVSQGLPSRHIVGTKSNQTGVSMNFDPLLSLSDGQLISLVFLSYAVGYWLTVYVFGNPYQNNRSDGQ